MFIDFDAFDTTP